MKKILLFLLALGGCAQSKHSPNGDESRIIRVRVVTEKTDKEVSYQLDTTRVADAQTGNLTKIADGLFTGQITLSTTAVHDLQLFNETADITPHAEVTIDDYRVCARDSGLITFALPVTMDESCKDALVERIKRGRRISTQETSFPLTACENSDGILQSGMDVMFFDVEWFNFENCRQMLKAFGQKKIKRIVYVNPKECMGEPFVNDRPSQKALCDEVRAKYPNWLMTNTDGSPLITFMEYNMQALNLSDQCPKYEVNGIQKVWSQFFIDYYAAILAKYPDLVDGVELDNGEAYISWQLVLTGSNGNSLNGWETDLSWRGGYKGLLKYARKQFGQQFLIGTVSNSPFFGGLADFVIYESPFTQRLGARSPEAKTFSYVFRLFELSAAYRFVVVQDCEGMCGSDERKGENHLESGYAFTLLVPNSLFIFDQSGPTAHGGFQMNPLYTKPGLMTEPVSYPFKSLDKRDKVSTGVGDDPITPKKSRGFLHMNYELLDGVFGLTNLIFPGADTKPTDWVDGPINTFIDSDFPISVVGAGLANLLGFELFSEPDGMFCAPYASKKLCFNPDLPSGMDVEFYREMSFRGKTISVPPFQGKVIQ